MCLSDQVAVQLWSLLQLQNRPPPAPPSSASYESQRAHHYTHRRVSTVGSFRPNTPTSPHHFHHLSGLAAAMTVPLHDDDVSSKHTPNTSPPENNSIPYIQNDTMKGERVDQCLPFNPRPSPHAITTSPDVSPSGTVSGDDDPASSQPVSIHPGLHHLGTGPASSCFTPRIPQALLISGSAVNSSSVSTVAFADSPYDDCAVHLSQHLEQSPSISSTVSATLPHIPAAPLCTPLDTCSTNSSGLFSDF